jgi:cytochrome c oxidase assembly protein subunit 15
MKRPFTRFAWAVLAFNVAVIAWGALVRATGSGAGCGQHWPLCNGEVVPRSPGVEMAIEFTHRATSGLALGLVVALYLWARRALPRRHPARRAAGASLAFMLTEALLGAGLVLFGWVAKDASAGRGFAMALHLANTFLLLAALALTAGWGDEVEPKLGLQSGALRRLVVCSGAALLLAGVSGAVAALGDTLFPAVTFAAGLRQELSEGAHVLLRLRVAHPFAALLAAGLLLGTAGLTVKAHGDARLHRAALVLSALVVTEFLAGVVNLVLLAPLWMQLVHLVLADLTWVALVLTAGWSALPGARPREVLAGDRRPATALG